MRLAALGLVLATAAFAEEAKVTVKADVVHAQLKAGLVEAGLTEMQTALAQGKQGKRYGALKRLSTQKLTLQLKALTLPLPNGKSADLSLLSLEQDVSTVKVKLAPGESTLKLGREGSLYQHAGEWQGGDLWLVLSQPK